MKLPRASGSFLLIASLALSCNAITGVNDLTFDLDGGASGSAGSAGSAGGSSCGAKTEVSACQDCCEEAFPAGRANFGASATKNVGCPQECQRECQASGCEGAPLKGPECPACIAQKKGAEGCNAGDTDCVNYVQCVSTCGTSPDHGSCGSITNGTCTGCCGYLYPTPEKTATKALPACCGLVLSTTKCKNECKPGECTAGNVELCDACVLAECGLACGGAYCKDYQACLQNCGK